MDLLNIIRILKYIKYILYSITFQNSMRLPGLKSPWHLLAKHCKMRLNVIRVIIILCLPPKASVRIKWDTGYKVFIAMPEIWQVLNKVGHYYC